MKGKNSKKVVKLNVGNIDKVNQKVTDSEKIERAKALLMPSLTAAKVIKSHYLDKDDVDMEFLAEELQRKSKAIINGNMADIEDLLITQAYALNTVFGSALSAAAAAGIPSYDKLLKLKDSYVKLGLRAQAQSRATLETLANIKNPPHLAFVRQQNVAYQQQVNNGVSTLTEAAKTTNGNKLPGNSSHAKKNNFSSNKLLTEGDNLNATLDTEATSGTVEKD